MSLPVPSPDHVIVLDDQRAAEPLRAYLVREHAARVTVHVVPIKAREAIQAATDDLPAFGLTDQVGLEPFSDGSCWVETLRHASPLSVIILYSESAFADRCRLDECLSKRLIDHAIRKGDVDKLRRTIQECRQRWDNPVAHKLRAYIATCLDADVPYVTNGERVLSLADEHREIVLGTDLGARLARVWEAVLLA